MLAVAKTHSEISVGSQASQSLKYFSVIIESISPPLKMSPDVFQGRIPGLGFDLKK